ncbi:MAG: AraC family transcriptional regulator [Cyclobacteriaceae bacterium]
MQPLIQKLPLTEGRSFIARTFETPLFETPFHQHNEVELVLCRGSNGTAFIGDYINEYEFGEIYLLGKNLPHWFRKKEKEMIGRALVIQFNEDMFGSGTLALPELDSIKELLKNARKGIKLKGELHTKVKKELNTIEEKTGFGQLMSLLDCLHAISISGEYDYLNKSYFLDSSKDVQNKIGTVLEYTMNHYTQKIKLEEVAQLINQSIPRFCKYFKTNTKKTYVQFLNEVRINHACKLIKTSNRNITDICYESGFRNWANFSVQFKRICNMTPTQYRNKHLGIN